MEIYLPGSMWLEFLENENIVLISEVTIEEVKNPVFSMHADKSPGPDSFNPAFFFLNF